MAEPRFRNPLKGNIYRVIDGDTVEVLLDRGWGDSKLTALRIQGVDAPEKSTRKNPLERRAGRLVMWVVVKWMADRESEGEQFYASSEVKPKYEGRTIGRLWAGDFARNGSELSEFLLAGGFVRPYSGATRTPWPDDQLHAIITAAEVFVDPPAPTEQ